MNPQRTLWIALILTAAFFLPGCSMLGDFQKRMQSSAARKLGAAKAEQYRKAHADFRNQPGWRKQIYRQPELLAQATPQNTAVEIALREQRGILLVNGAVAMDFPVATGRASHPTPRGSYKILDKKKDYASNLYGRIVSATGETLVSDADTREDAVPEGGSFVGSRMPYWMRITPTGLGMHVGYVPGRPASHGCIRLKQSAAVELFGILAPGTPVTVEFFAPTLGGPVGLESVVTSEAAHNAPPARPRLKPAATPAATTPTPAQDAPPPPAAGEPAPPAAVPPAPAPQATPAPAPTQG